MANHVMRGSTAVQIVSMIIAAKIVLIGLVQWGRWSAVSGHSAPDIGDIVIWLGAFTSLLALSAALGITARFHNDSH